MRFQMSLRLVSTGNLLPINYKYELSSWIYKVFALADPAFSEWLHERGYDWSLRKFKFFTFSDLKFAKFSVISDRVLIEHPEVKLDISFLMEEPAEKFIIGLFSRQVFDLGDIKSRVRFEVVKICTVSPPVFTGCMTFRCASPICVTSKGDLDKYVQYTNPADKTYEFRFFDNLISKYIALRQQLVLTGCGPELPEQEVHEQQQKMKLEVLSEPRSRLVTIKADKAEETKVRGFIYKFTVTAPPDLLRIAYYAGFGEKNSLGFGCCDVSSE